MIKMISKTLSFLAITLVVACSYKPIFTQQNYNFKIEEIKFNGNKDINRVIKNKLNQIQSPSEQTYSKYFLNINTDKKRVVLSKDSEGDPLKFELIITTNFEVEKKEKILLNKEIKKNYIYNNSSDKFKLEQDERIILNNISEEIGNLIISSIINLDDN